MVDKASIKTEKGNLTQSEQTPDKKPSNTEVKSKQSTDLNNLKFKLWNRDRGILGPEL